MGTPASGTLTSCTGYTYANLSGTVPTWNQNTTGTAAGLSATLVATSGGTGQSTYAVGDLLQGGATNTLNKLTAVATGNALISGGVTTASSWGKIGLTTHVSGTLPVANGGTGITSLGTGVATFLGTPSSANLASAVTDETGSGSLVFATSPTLTTPVLGTPSSGTLTSCTGLPISTGVSGLGTGVATFLATPSSANLAAALTDETGTGANVFANSPTLVTPALGTPSSGTLTNCTFPTLNQNTTGSAATVTGNATGTTFGFNSGYGSVATAYGCRAWVNFNGTGTVAIRDSGNVTSITDNGTGLYTINFTNAMPDADYCMASSGSNATSTSSRFVGGYTYNTGSTAIFTQGDAGTASDAVIVNAAFFR